MLFYHTFVSYYFFTLVLGTNFVNFLTEFGGNYFDFIYFLLYNFIEVIVVEKDKNNSFLENDSIVGSSVKDNNNLKSENMVGISMDKINKLNIVINDNDCGNAFFDDICEQLEKKGVKFKISRKNDNLKYDNATILTLDQQMVTGVGISLIGPYHDGTANNSEALLKSIQMSLQEHDYSIECIAGIPRYQSEEDGDVVYTTIPSSTEQDSLNTSAQITIAIGTMTPDFSADSFSDDIIHSLARYQYYLEYDSTKVNIDSNPDKPTTPYDNHYYFNEQINLAKAFNPDLVFKVN